MASIERKGYMGIIEPTSIEEHIHLAERHAQMALNQCYTRKGTVRGYFFCAALGRAQSILINLYQQELKRKP